MVAARHLTHTRATQEQTSFNRQNLHRRNHQLALIVATIANPQRIDEVAVQSASDNSKFNRKVQIVTTLGALLTESGQLMTAS
jgi:hypothetical protein